MKITDSMQKVLKRAEKEAAKIKSVKPILEDKLPEAINFVTTDEHLLQPKVEGVLSVSDHEPTFMIPSPQDEDKIKKGFKTSEFWLILAFSLANIFGAAAQILPPKSALAAASISTGIYTFGRTALKLKALFSSLFHKNSN